MKSPGEVVTFYSYKGGTGRTMSLVNLAWLLADKLPFGEKILLVDWDLEAPGLHRYFHETLRPVKPGADGLTNDRPADDLPGVIDLFTTLLEHSQEASIRRKRNPELKARALLDRIDLADYIVATSVPNLHVIKAGRFDADYADRINDFDWSAFYEAQPLVFRELAERLKQDYRYVFIDSRTGQTDTSGICTALLPEKLVAVFTPNRQSLLGLETVLQQAISYRKAADDARPLVVYPLPSRVEINQDALRRTWRFGDLARRIEGYEPFFSRLFSKNYGLKYCHLKKYFDEVQIKQSSIYAFGEEIAVREERSQKVEDSYSLTQAYQNLLSWLQPGYLPWEHPEVIRLLKALESRASAKTAEPDALAELVFAANELMKTLCADANYGNAHILGRHTLRHARKVLGEEHPGTLATMNNLAHTLWAQGDLSGARALQEQTLAVCRRMHGDEHPDTLTAMNNLASTLEAQGDFAGARALQEPTLAVRRRVLGDEHPDTLTAMNNLASTLEAQGDFAGARALQEPTLAVRRRLLGDEHPDTLIAMANLAGTLREHGDLAEARMLEEQALAIRRRVLGDGHPATLKSMGNLAYTLWVQGDLAGARVLEEQTLVMSRRTLGDEHPSTLTAMNNLAGTLRAQGDLAGARTLEEEALAKRRRVLGDEHPATLKSMGNLAHTLWAEGDLAGARTLEEEALAVSRRVLGDEHPDTLTAMHNLAGTLDAQGDLAGARTLQEQALAVSRRIRGDEHPDTLTAMNNLAGTLDAQGDLAGARTLQEQALAVSRRIRGDEHPDTLISTSNLAGTLGKQGDLAGARMLQEQVLAGRRRVLGDEHPDTLDSMNYLATTLRALNEFAPMRMLLEELLARQQRTLGAQHPAVLDVQFQLQRLAEAEGNSAAANSIREEIEKSVASAARTQRSISGSGSDNTTFFPGSCKRQAAAHLAGCKRTGLQSAWIGCLRYLFRETWLIHWLLAHRSSQSAVLRGFQRLGRGNQARFGAHRVERFSPGRRRRGRDEEAADRPGGHVLPDA